MKNLSLGYSVWTKKSMNRSDWLFGMLWQAEARFNGRYVQGTVAVANSPTKAIKKSRDRLLKKLTGEYDWSRA